MLFGVDLDVAEGEIVALLGTNGAGKSTILKAICGLAPSSGTVTLDGGAIAKHSAEQIVRSGRRVDAGRQGDLPDACRSPTTSASPLDVPQGRGTDRGRPWTRCYRLFPVLGDRKQQLAGDLSGGEQQQLALAMTLLLRPRVLLIDELSLGLSPMIVAALCEVVRELNRNGMTVIVVEQSVNVALTLAERAVFMEKGTVRFVGPTRELLERPDLLRSVFIEGAGGDGTSDVEDQADEVLAKIDLARLSDRDGQRGDPRLRRAGPRVPRRDQALRRRARADRRRPRASDPGEIVGLIGQNGAGKTTLMDCISGFHALDGGIDRVPRRRHHRLGALRAGAGSPGPDVPGGPPVPVAHRRRDDRRRV